MPITKEFYVELDLKQTTGNRDFTLVEGDTGNVIHVTLKDGGAPVDLTDCRVLAVFTKPTGSSMQDSAIEDGGVTIGGTDGNEVTIDLFSASFGTGTNACELQIYSGAELDVLVTSAAFNFYCRNGIIDDDTILSTDEYPLLTSLIAQVQAIEDGVLTPADLDGSLSADSDNPVKNSVIKEALDGKAAASHTHTVSGITDFPATMPPSAHTHTVSGITDFPATMPPSPHTHGSITADGRIGSAADLPVFTGANGAVSTKTADDALALLGGLSMTLLWENAAPTSTFPAQTIAIDATGYDGLMVYWENIGSARVSLPIIALFNEEGDMGSRMAIAFAGNGANVFSGNLLASVRQMSAATHTSVTFEGGYSINPAGTTWTPHDNWMIPLRIYGIKGVA